MLANIYYPHTRESLRPRGMDKEHGQRQRTAIHPGATGLASQLLGRLRNGDRKFKPSLGYRASSKVNLDNLERHCFGAWGYNPVAACLPSLFVALGSTLTVTTMERTCQG